MDDDERDGFFGTTCWYSTGTHMYSTHEQREDPSLTCVRSLHTTEQYTTGKRRAYGLTPPDANQTSNNRSSDADTCREPHADAVFEWMTMSDVSLDE